MDASTGELIGTTSSGGLDFGHMFHYARSVGALPIANAGRRRLLQMPFPERGKHLSHPAFAGLKALAHRPKVHGAGSHRRGIGEVTFSFCTFDRTKGHEQPDGVPLVLRT